MASTYDVGTRAWQPDAAEGWVASELVKRTVDGGKAKLVFKLENGEVCSGKFLLRICDNLI
jgi:myosin-5